MALSLKENLEHVEKIGRTIEFLQKQLNQSSEKLRSLRAQNDQMDLEINRITGMILESTNIEKRLRQEIKDISAKIILTQNKINAEMFLEPEQKKITPAEETTMHQDIVNQANKELNLKDEETKHHQLESQLSQKEKEKSGYKPTSDAGLLSDNKLKFKMLFTENLKKEFEKNPNDSQPKSYFNPLSYIKPLNQFLGFTPKQESHQSTPSSIQDHQDKMFHAMHDAYDVTLKSKEAQDLITQSPGIETDFLKNARQDYASLNPQNSRSKSLETPYKQNYVWPTTATQRQTEPEPIKSYTPALEKEKENINVNEQSDLKPPPKLSDTLKK